METTSILVTLSSVLFSQMQLNQLNTSIPAFRSDLSVPSSGPELVQLNVLCKVMYYYDCGMCPISSRIPGGVKNSARNFKTDLVVDNFAVMDLQDASEAEAGPARV